MAVPTTLFCIIICLCIADFIFIQYFGKCIEDDICPNNVFSKIFLILQTSFNILIFSYYTYHLLAPLSFYERFHFRIQLGFLCYILLSILYSFIIFYDSLLVKGMLYYYLQIVVHTAYILLICSVLRLYIIAAHDNEYLIIS